MNHGAGPLPTDRDFLFEPTENWDLDLYAQLVDSTTSTIMVRNDSDHDVTLPCRSRLGMISEMDYSNCCYAGQDPDCMELAIKESKETRRTG